MMMAQYEGNIPLLADIIDIMEHMAPPYLAEEWDNSGLQVGKPGQAVKKILIALDPQAQVIGKAIKQSADLVITHHPLILRPLQRLDLETGIGKIIDAAITSQTAIYAAHTNLDSVQAGINDILAEKIGLQNTTSLAPYHGPMDEDLIGDSENYGLGRVGELRSAIRLSKLVEKMKTVFNLKVLRFTGNPEMSVHRVAVCSGSGSGLLNDFLDSTAQVYISGDLRYHDARIVEEAGKALIDIGHFASEHIIVDVLTQRLRQAVKAAEWQVAIEPCHIEKDPFIFK
ncbi:MAG: Nif3-like dinuclear metal center hexameric protein [Desulfobacteraceae bacterium]|nr:Nif3-like dinuclear metal center hexameric protein [Desulfobacteraceae bacterium]